MSTKAQHRAKVGLPPLVFGPQWVDMLRHAYVQPVLSKARQDYMNKEAKEKAIIAGKPYTVVQDSTLASLVEPEVTATFAASNYRELEIFTPSESGDVITRTLDTCDLLLDKPKRKYVRKAKVAVVNHE
jgi:hypothetical protein